MLVSELVVVVMLLLPAPHKYLSWKVNQVPTQVQLTFKYNIQASYQAENVPCETNPEAYELLLVEDSEYMRECYLVDVKEPIFVRHPNAWMEIRDIVEHDNKQNPFQSKPIRGWERLP